jgi:PPOX class probable F420-dependent enzyme
MPTMRPRSGHAAIAIGHIRAMSSPTVATARIRRFLENELVVWLSTIRPDGAPHLVPIWFWWDGEALLVFSKSEAQKVRNVRANPSVMLALGDAEDDFDVGLVEGRAELLDRPAADILPAGLLTKYADRLAAIGVDPVEYARTYSQVIRIVPHAYLGWHGRTTPRSVRVSGAPAVSIEEPRRTTDGEPVCRRRPRPQPRIVEPARPSLGDRLRGPLLRGFGAAPALTA